MPKEELRHHVLGLLNSGEGKPYMLIEIAQIADPALTAWFLAQPSLPRQILRALPGASARIQNSQPHVYRSTRELAVAHEVFSAEIDEEAASETISELAPRVGWPGAVPAFDVDHIKRRRARVLWRDQDRILTATREDETTLILVWQVSSS